MSYADQIKRDRAAAKRARMAVEDGVIVDDMSAKEIAEVLRPRVARELLKRLDAGEVGGPDLVKLLSGLSDRIDGKVPDKMELGGVVGVAAVLADISGMTAGLPARGEVEKYAGVLYDPAEDIDARFPMVGYGTVSVEPEEGE